MAQRTFSKISPKKRKVELHLVWPSMYGSTPLFHWYYLLSSPPWDIPHWCGVRRLVRGRGSRSKWVRVPIRVRVWIRVKIRVKSRVRVRVRVKIGFIDP